MKRVSVLLIVVIFLAGCAGKAEPVRMTDFALGTVCSVTLYDPDKESLLPEVFSRMREYENILSRNIPDSEISDLNRNAGVAPVAMSDIAYSLLDMGLRYGDISRGLFDITIAPVTELWGIGTDHAAVPDSALLQKTLSHVDYHRLILDGEKQTAFLEERESAVDLGGIAKGYIGDLICDFLRKEHVSGGILDLGGNILVFGKKPDGSDFRVGIQNPFKPRGNYIGIVSMKEGTVVTSGIYERFFEQGGMKYHHIFDTRTGYPVDNELAGVSIITDVSAAGDALSTTVFAMGLEEGKAFLESLPGTEGVFITRDNRVIITSGLKDRFTAAR
ncbi:MAG: FAD:protein FMN transferase [Spirochaetia bacterium]|nr:FAD:protein FMN transferase [Spirochaetia bacterium]